MTTLKEFEPVIRGLLMSPEDQVDPAIKFMIRNAKTVEDWGHLCNVCKELQAVPPLTLSFLETINKEINNGDIGSDSTGEDLPGR